MNVLIYSWLFSRVYALYQRNKMLGAFLITYLTAELGVALWIYLTPTVRRKHRMQLFTNLW